MSAVMPATQERVTTIAELKNQPQAPQVHIGWNDQQSFALMQRVATALASSSLVPQQFQSNLPNCLIALEMAQRIGASPLMVMQNLYVVHGRPGWSAKFLIASFNQCGRFTALRFEWSGTEGKDDWGCRAWAIEKATGERIQGPTITIHLAKEEGWFSRNGSKWKTIPELMLTYRAAAWLVNTHAPEISMGLNTAEEIHDVFEAQAASDGTFVVGTTAELSAVVPSNQDQKPEAPALYAAGGEAPFTFEECVTAIESASNIEILQEAADAAGGLTIDSRQQKQLKDAVLAARKRLEA